MSRNGSGVYTLPSPAPFSNGTTISAPGMNTVQSDIATALTGSLAADGQTPVTGDFNWGGNDLSDVGTFDANAVAMNVGTCSGVFAAANGTATTQVVNYQQFASTLTATGTAIRPGGLIEKWGAGTTTLGTGSVTFAAEFPASCHNVQISINGGTGTTSLDPLVVGTVAKTGFAVWGNAAQSLSFFWFAVGN